MKAESSELAVPTFVKLTEPKNILIARLSSIGDIILTSPALRCLRKAFPEVKITFLVKKEFIDLVIYNPNINEVISFDKTGGWKALIDLRKLIWSKKFDWFIDLHNNLRTNLLKRTIGFDLVTTYHKESFRRYLLVKFGKNFFREARPIYLKYFDALKYRNINYDGEGTNVFIPESSMLAIQNKLGSERFRPEKGLLVICPGASFSNKQWLPERFGEVADHFIEASGMEVVFLGGKNDRELCNTIIRGMRSKALNYAGELPILLSATLLQKATAVLTNDSGMMHLAQSQGTAVVAIFGPTTRELGFFPIPQNSMVIEKEVSCRPCTTKGLNYCPKKHFRCMNSIETKEIVEALSGFIDRHVSC